MVCVWLGKKDLSDIQIKFLREDDSDALSINAGTIDLDSVNYSGNELTIVYPFHIDATGISTESIEIPLDDSFILDASGQNLNDSIAGEVSISVGKIRLNLVDVEGKENIHVEACFSINNRT